MALPFLNNSPKKRSQLIGIDLASRTTKAVYLERKGNGFAMSRYAILDAPIYEKNLSVDLLSEHLKNVAQALDVKTKQVAVAVNMNNSVVRTTEMPLMPVYDMRQILKNNTKVYLQQDLPGHIFDCYIIPPKTLSAATDKKGGGNILKTKVLAAGAKKQIVDDYQAAIKGAGLIPDFIVPSLVGPVNAFEISCPDVFSTGTIALVDVGFKSSSICLLQEGELVLSRVLNIGGDKLTSGLAEAMGISYAEAEGIKLGMPSEVQPHLEGLVAPLGRELRASIDFFEHQQDKTVTHVYITGGSARSELIVQLLQTQLVAECKTWSPTSSLQLNLASQQLAEIEHVAPQLTVAIGTALAAF